MSTTKTDAPGDDTYARLSAPFESTFHDTRGGVELEYITGEQCISRLNEVLGPFGWSFEVVEHGVNVEADEMWCLGRLNVYPAGAAEPGIRREQFGSQKIKRSRSSGSPLDIGFDLKGAGTDALKKCASLIGVGLYLSKKEQPAQQPSSGGIAPQTNGTVSQPTANQTFACDECGVVLGETRFKDGTTWAPAQLAGYGRRKHDKVLCMDHYRAANEKRRTDLLSA